MRGSSPSLVARMLLACSVCVPVREWQAAAYTRPDERPQHMLPDHTFAAPLLGEYWRGGVKGWRLTGSAVATQDGIRLTPAQPNRAGAVQNVIPVAIDHWEATCSFRIHSTALSGADGFAIWFTREPADGSGPLWGQAADFEGFGLVFDTYDNNQRGDGAQMLGLYRPKGAPVKAWDIENDLYNTNAFRCVQQLRGGKILKKPHSVILRYRYNKLEVMLRKPGDYRNTYCGVLKDVVFPAGYYFSISARTAGLWDNHDIHSFEVTSAPRLEAKKEQAHRFDPQKDAEEQRRHDGAQEQ